MLEEISIEEARPLFEQYHQYAGLSSAATYLFGLRDQGRVIAAFAWQPPAFGAAKSTCPEAPQAVLSLSLVWWQPRRKSGPTCLSRRDDTSRSCFDNKRID